MKYLHILCEVKHQILYITINREQKLNALNKATLSELGDAIAFASSSAEVRAVLITGAGPKAFVAGADISEFSAFDARQGEDLARKGQQLVFDAIENCTRPVIAAINGFALGGGLELALACHLRIASVHAKLGLPEVTLGLIPGYGGTQRLSRLVGKGKAMEMILTADMITADEALKIGLVNHVVPEAELAAKAEEILSKIRLRAPRALAAAIKAINSSERSDVDGYEVEIKQFGECFNTDDFKEGVAAFMEKRKPLFVGK